MKKIFALLLFASAVFSASAQTSISETKPAADVLLLKQPGYDFGKIQQGRPVTHLFEIVNTGTQPIRLENVTATCGCTTPEWSREAIAPGASATIRVGYNSAAEGPFQKTVAITYNGGLTKTILISGNVYKAPATPAPVNPSLTLFKVNTQ